jgi:hypothetical protein
MFENKGKFSNYTVHGEFVIMTAMGPGRHTTNVKTSWAGYPL